MEKIPVNEEEEIRIILERLASWGEDIEESKSPTDIEGIDSFISD